MRMKKIPYLLSLMMLCITGVNAQTTGEEFDYEKIAITPADRSTVESLKDFDITFGGQAVTVNAEHSVVLAIVGNEENAVANGVVTLNADGSAHVSLDQEITTPGNYQLNIERALVFQGTILNPLSFKYTIASMADFTINPAEGKVESLSTFTITFNNYMVEAGDDAKAYLFNEETEEEINGSVYDMGGKGVYVMLDKEVTTAGEWQLNIEGVKKLIDDSDVELIFTYTIGQNVVDGVISAKNAADGLNGAAIYNLQGQKLNKAQKGLNIVNGKKMYMK